MKYENSVLIDDFSVDYVKWNDLITMVMNTLKFIHK